MKKAILEEIPIRDTINHRMENWIPELNLSVDEPLLDEARAIEFCQYVDCLSCYGYGV